MTHQTMSCLLLAMDLHSSTDHDSETDGKVQRAPENCAHVQYYVEIF